MKAYLVPARPALVATAVLAVLCCGLYPAVVTGFSAWLFPRQAAGSLMLDGNGALRGSSLLGQNFHGTRYFHPRPSAAGTNGYDATSSGGSNLGPTSKKLADQIAKRVVSYREENHLAAGQPLPADSVTVSASGLDPHISPANAALQAVRVARARGLPVREILDMIDAHTDEPAFGFIGDPGVNVLELNRALEAHSPTKP